MKTLIEKHIYGLLLEDDITTAINKTSLAKYTLTDLVIKTQDTWRQVDIAIILPHKIVLIEAKNTTAEEYIIYRNKDIYSTQGVETDYGKSIVNQTEKTKTILSGIFSDERHKYNLTIESIGCIRAQRVTNHQTVLPIHSDKTIWYYLKTLESELQTYNQALVDRLHTEYLKTLKPFVRKPETYQRYLKKQGHYNTNRMLVPKEQTTPTDLTFSIQPGGIHEAHQSRKQDQDRANRIISIVSSEINKPIPNWVYDYIIKHKTLSDWTLCEFFVGVMSLNQTHQKLLYDLTNKFGSYIEGKYIVDYCKTRNIFFVELLHECVKYIKTYHLEYYKKLLSGVKDEPPEAFSFSRVVSTL